jgi:hypothetical protein
MSKSSPWPSESTRPAPGVRTGLVRNPLSRRNRKAGARPHLAGGEVLLAEPDSIEGLTEALADFARREVGLVIVDGGDGTVREVLTALPHAYGDILPKLAVLSSGTTNLIAADVGAGRADAGTVRTLDEAMRTGRVASLVQRRSTLQVSWPEGERAPVHGMFLGAAAFTRATDISVRLVRQGRVDESAGIAATLMSALAQTVAADGAPVSGGRRFVFLASTLEKLVLGLWPFWGEGGGVRYLDIAAPPKRLVSALPAVMRGRPRPWMEAAGYRSGSAARIDLELREPFVVDGEVFETGPSGRVRLTPGLMVDFVVP